MRPILFSILILCFFHTSVTFATPAAINSKDDYVRATSEIKAGVSSEDDVIGRFGPAAVIKQVDEKFANDANEIFSDDSQSMKKYFKKIDKGELDKDAKEMISIGMGIWGRQQRPYRPLQAGDELAYFKVSPFKHQMGKWEGAFLILFDENKIVKYVWDGSWVTCDHDNDTR